MAYCVLSKRVYNGTYTPPIFSTGETLVTSTTRTTKETKYYGMTLDDIKNFRQWGSPTAGHPEYGHAPGIETTTGPLGQGFGNGVGMALAERWLAERFNKRGYDIVNHYTYALCSDGDLMEGVASEAASIAGFLKLGKLIYFYDDNTITIDGHTDLAFSENVGMRFEAYGWHVQH